MSWISDHLLKTFILLLHSCLFSRTDSISSSIWQGGAWVLTHSESKKVRGWRTRATTLLSFLFLSQSQRPKCLALSCPSRYTGAREAGPRLAEYQAMEKNEWIWRKKSSGAWFRSLIFPFFILSEYRTVSLFWEERVQMVRRTIQPITLSLGIVEGWVCFPQ